MQKSVLYALSNCPLKSVCSYLDTMFTMIHWVNLNKLAFASVIQCFVTCVMTNNTRCEPCLMRGLVDFLQINSLNDYQNESQKQMLLRCSSPMSFIEIK